MMNEKEGVQGVSSLELLNNDFIQLNIKERIKRLFEMYKPEDILFTSSFGSDAVLLLHLVAQLKPALPVYFIDTGFHFKETHQYKEIVSSLLGLNVVDLNSTPEAKRISTRNRLWKSCPDLCCFLNKVSVLEPLLRKHKVWLSGIYGYQTSQRDRQQIFSYWNDQVKILKCCPLLDLTAEDVKDYKAKYQLPIHPLVHKGYASIGCQPCTIRGAGRNGRWTGLEKTECGLHHS